MSTKFSSVLHGCVRSIALVTLLCVQVLFASAFALNAPTNVSVSGLTPTAGTLQWEVAFADAHEYDLIVSTQSLSSSVLGNATTPCTVTAATEGVVIFVSKAALASATTYALTGLTEGTHYYLYFRQNGESQYEDNSAWVTYEFSTPCVATSVLPVLADFDGGNYLPSCWSSGAKAPTFSSAVKHGESGNSMLLSATASDGCFAYSPVFTGNAHAYYLKAYVYGVAGATYRVGVAPANDLLLTELILEGTITTANTWTPIDVTIPAEIRAELEQGVEYVWVIYNSAADNAKAFYVDDVEIDELPTCIAPASLTASMVTESSVTLSWMERGTATSWLVEYVHGTDTLTATASANPFVLSDLLVNTVYTIRVKAVCSAADQSAWTQTVTVKTPCSVLALPYSENFDSYTTGASIASSRPANAVMPECWDWAGDEKSYCLVDGGSYAYSGKSLHFRTSASGVADNAYALLPAFDAENAATMITLKYKYESTTSGADLVVGYLTVAGDVTSFVPVKTLARATTFTDAEVYFPAMPVLYAAIRNAKSPTSYYDAGIDNLVVKFAPTCFKPSALVFREATSTTLKMEIQDAEDATAWEYAIDTLNPVAVTEKIFTIDNLTPETAYTIFVRRACSATDHSAWISARATTTMAPVDFIEEDFNNTATRIKGWSYISRTSTSYPSFSATSGVNGTPCWYMYGYSSSIFSAVIALPEISGNLSEYRFLMDAKKTTADNPGDVLIGIADTNGGDITYVDSITPNTSAFATYSMDLSSYTGTGKFPVLYFRGFQTSIYVDNIVLEPIPTCERPQGIEVAHPSATSVDVTITDSLAHSAWEVVVVEKDADPATGTPVLVSEKTATVAGTFVGDVVYDVYVRTVCSDTDKSRFCGPVSFKFIDYSTVTDVPLEGIGNYPWTIITEGGVNKLQSTNQGVHSTESEIQATIVVPETAIATLSFEYAASGEGSSTLWDYLCVFVDQANPSASNYQTDFAANGRAGTPDGVSGTYSIELTPGTHTVRWRYHKDGSGSGGEDGAKIWNILLTSSSAWAPIDLELVSVDATSAVISWMQCPDVVKNEVKLGDQIFETTTNSISLSSLTPATNYSVKVRSILDADTTAWSDSLAFRTDCAAFAVPFAEGFEQEGAELCWKTIGNAVTIGSTTSAFDGAKALVVVNDSVAGMLVSPQLNVTSLAEYEVAFAINLSNVRYHAAALKPLTIGVMTDPNDVGTYIDLGDIVIPSSGSWKEYRFSLADLASDDYAEWAGAQYIAISMSDSATYRFDAITVAPAASCPKPTALDVQPNGEGVEITWVSDAAAHYAEIALGDSVVFAGNVVNPFAPVALEGNTLYKVRVRAICDAETSEWTPWTSFTTPCTFAELPYEEGFEDYTASTFPDCWTQKQTEAGTGTSGTVYGDKCWVVNTTTGASYIHSGSKSLKLQDTRSGTHTTLSLPVMYSPREGGLTFSFWMYRVTGTSKPDEGVKVWVNSVPSLEGATPLMHVTRCGGVAADSLKVAPVSTAGWYQYEAVLPIVGTTYVLLEGISEYGAASYVDDIRVIETPVCVKPSNLLLAEPETTSAKLTWTAGLNETTWQLIYKLSSKTAADTVLVTGTPEYTITGLTSGTNYTLSALSLQSVCSATDSSERAIFPNITFTTACGLNATPYMEGFEDGTVIPNCWYQEQTVVATSTSGTDYGNRCWVVNTTAGATSIHTGSKSLKLQDTRNGTHTILALPAMHSNAANELKFSFWMYRTTGASKENEGVKVWVNSTQSLEGATPLMHVTRCGGVEADSLKVAPITTSGWYKYEATLPVVGDFHVILEGISEYGAASYVDDIDILAVDGCEHPVTVKAVATTYESATIAVNDEEGTAWEYVVNDKTAAPVAVAADTFVVSGLEPITTYTVYVRRVCGADNASAWVGTTFMTDADCRGLLTVPFADGFETYPTGSSTSDGPYCWDMLNTNNGTYPYAYVSASTTYVHSGSKALYMSSSTTVNAFAVMPAFETPLNQLRLQFNCKFGSATASGKLYVGYMTDVTSAASFVQLQVVDQNTSWQAVTVDLADVPADAVGARIAFKYGTGTSGGNYLAIDDIEVTMLPFDETIESIVATNVKRISAELTWIPAAFNTCNQYELVLSTSALSEAELATAAPIMLDTTFYQASELLRGTRYYAYVRTGCAIDGGFGKWVSTSFITRALSGDGDYTVNPTDGTSSSYVPYAGWYHNSYAQAIYTPADLENCGPTTINAIDLNYYNATSMTRHVAVYMANITENKLTGFLSPANLVEVYAEKEYTFSNANGNWDHMVLDTPFDYTGGNLLVVFYMNYNACETFYASGSRFYTHSASSMTRYLTADTATPDYIPVTNGIYTGTSTGTNSDYRPNIRFWAAYEDAACPVVTGAEATLIGLGTSEVQLSWPASDGDYANTYEVCIADTDTLAAADVTPQYTGIDTLGLRLTGLQEATQYYAYIRVICNARGHDEGASEWFVLPFATNASCLPVVDLVATVTGKHTAKAVWSKSLEDQDDAFLYILSENELDSAALLVASAMPVDTAVLMLENLLSEQTYHLYVAASCGANHSPYVHTSFTMPTSCPAVVDLTAVRVSEAAAILSWAHAQYAEENLWEVGIVGDASFTQLVADTTVTIFGLAEDSTYTAYVKAICAEGDTSVVATTTFTTLSADAASCVTTGHGTTTSNTIPFNNYYKNAWNQIIYTADQVGHAGTITSISFNLAAVNATGFTADQLTIYLANTDMEYAATTSSWISQSDLVQVFTASNYAYPSSTGWVTFDLATPFDYDGGNLAVVTSQTTSTYNSSYTWAYTARTNGVTLYRCSDTDASYAQYPTLSGTMRTYQPDATFCFATGGCMKPMSLKVANLTTVSADMSWFPGGSETAWEYVLGTSELTAAQLEEAAAVALSDVKTSLTGLVPDQDYYFYVRALCTDTTSSDWAMLHFVTVPTCLVVSAIEVEDVAANTATISWTSESEGIRYVVAYAPVATFNLADPASYATVQTTGLSAELTGLLPNTLYAVAVRVICSDTDESRWSEVVNFRTDCVAHSLPYAEDFEEGYDTSVLPTTTTAPAAANVVLPYCWAFANNKVLEGTSVYPQAFLTAYSYYVGSGANALFFKATSSEYVYAALPEFAISEPTTVSMSFKYRNESVYSGNGPVEVVRINEEGQVTPLYSAEIVSSFTDVTVDNIELNANDRLAFRYKGSSTTVYYAAVDDIRVARVAKADTIFDTTCAGGDYDGHGFNIPAAQLTAGSHTFTYTRPATSDIEADTLYTLQLFVSQPSSIEFTDTVCAHEHYTGYGFDIADVDPLRTSAYVRHLTNQYGCDSTVSLTLFVPQTEFAETVHLCEGDSYTFGDSVVTTSGVYVHTYQSQYGCDSTVTLEIFFHAVASAITANICSGETYAFGDQTLDAAGTYTATFQNAAGCDSVVTLTLSVLEPVVTQINGVFCEGTSFAGGSISPKFMDLTVEGVYTDTLQSVVTGCDSILVLTLVEEKIQHTTVEGTYSEGKPFVYDGQSYQEAGTFEIVKTTVNGCDSIITLVVTKETGFDNLLIGDLHIAPNPVLVGEEAVIRTDIVFSSDFVLRVYDAVGRLVAETTEQTGRVPAMPVAGIYTVRIAAAGHHYQAKLIVK